MRDEDLRKLFREMKHGEPKEMQIASWKRVVRNQLDRTPSEWMRLAVACAVGFLIGAAVFKTRAPQENFDRDATVERISVNIQ